MSSPTSSRARPRGSRAPTAGDTALSSAAIPRRVSGRSPCKPLIRTNGRRQPWSNQIASSSKSSSPHTLTMWRALRDPVEIERWFGWDYAGLSEEVRMVADAVAGAETVDASGLERTLRVTGMADRYSLQSVDDHHTIVRIIRSAPVTDASWTGIYDDTIEGWLMFAQQLRFMLERHPGMDRRTLFLNGRAQAPGTALPLEALGLIGVASVPVGASYSVNVGPATRSREPCGTARRISSASPSMATATVSSSSTRARRPRTPHTAAERSSSPPTGSMIERIPGCAIAGAPGG